MEGNFLLLKKGARQTEGRLKSWVEVKGRNYHRKEGSPGPQCHLVPIQNHIAG